MNQRSALAGAMLLFVMLGSLLPNAMAQSSAPEGLWISQLAMKDAEGDVIESASAGQLVVLSTTLFSNMDNDQPYALILEIRDDAGVTQFLGFSIGNLERHGLREIGISWIPKQAGDYQLRTFAVSGFQDPDVLTFIQTVDIEIK